MGGKVLIYKNELIFEKKQFFILPMWKITLGDSNNFNAPQFETSISPFIFTWSVSSKPCPKYTYNIDL